MNDRERFVKTMTYEPIDRVPNHELGLWGQTYERWYSEGLPRDVLHGDFFGGEEFFGLDRREFIPINVGMIPAFDAEVLEETERYVVARHANGIVTKALKEGTVRGTRPSMDQYVDFAVHGREDFEQLKIRYNPHSPVRYPPYFGQRARVWNTRECPLCLLRNASFGFYSTPRIWMGTENLSLAFYDMPDLVHDMMDFLADFLIETVRRCVEKVEIDYFNFFEDMAYKTAPLVSPALFREFILPRYKRVIDFLKAHGIRFIIVDSDGNIEPLIPLLLEAGVTGIWPMEIAADMQPEKIRKEYGHDLTLWGGIDKRELTKDRKTIEREVLSKIDLVADGGYIPHVDHTVPHDVPYENFVYYMECKQRLLEGKIGS